MNELTTVFEITSASNGIRADTLFQSGIGVVGVIGGIVWLVHCIRTQEALLKKLWSPAFVIVWGIFWLVLHMPLLRIAIFDIRHLLYVYQSGQCEIAEGVVHVTHEQPAHGHTAGDKITIGGKEFEINYFLVIP